jgi:uncharacterized protein YndB with AHSA1/START domain
MTMIDRRYGLVVRKQITVQASQERAFAVFIDGLARWWSRDKQIGAQPMVEAVVEPREGGRWFERAADGSECDWCRVRVWDPPSRLVLMWQISGQWAYDAALETEVDVRFIAEGPDRTRVELEHRGLEAYGGRAAEMQAVFDSPGGWAGVLDAFAAATTTEKEQA